MLATCPALLALILVLAMPASAQITETFAFNNLNRAIPDGSDSGLSEFRDISSSIEVISKVRVKLRVNGEFNGDLYGYLTHGSGFTVLLNRPGRTAGNASGYGDSGLNMTFENGAANGDIHVYRNVSNPAAGSPLTGIWQPDGRNVDPAIVTDASARSTSLTSFNGVKGWGEWILFLADLESGGTNQLVSWELEITGPAQPALTWAIPANIVYGTVLGSAQLNATANVAGNFAYSPAAGAVLNAGNGQMLSVTFTPNDLAKYTVVSTNVPINVLPAPLTITAQNKVKTYGQTVPPLTASYVGLKNGDSPADLDDPPVLATTATQFSTATDYPITVTGASDPNYNITQVAGTLTILKAGTSGLVTVSQNPAVPGTPVTLTMTINAVSPGGGTPAGSVQFRSNGSPVGSPVNLVNGVANLTTSSLALGSHTISANYAGNANFEATSATLAQPLMINTPPTAVADVTKRYADQGVKILITTLLANDSDGDGDTVAFASVSPVSPGGGTLTIANGWIHYTPVTGFTNADSFTYVITDGRGGSSVGAVTINIMDEPTVAQNLVIEPQGDGSYHIRFQGIPGRTYTVQYSDSLTPANWKTLANVTADEQGHGEATDTPPPEVPSRYYRTVR